MEIVQKKRSTRHTFTFHDDYFNFSYKDKSGSGDVDISYADFPQKSSTLIEQNDWLRNVGLLWIVLGVLQLIYAIHTYGTPAGKGFWVIIGILCVTWSYFSKIKYSVFTIENGQIFVIQDKHHDKIINELNSRRKSQLRQWYGEINHENDLENEMQKFKWLADQNILTKEESDQKIAQVEFLQKESLSPSNSFLN